MRLTATVTAAARPTTDKVQFTDGGTSLGGNVSLDGDGTALLEATLTTAGTHQIQAVYVYNNFFRCAYSNTVPVTVSDTSTHATTTALGASSSNITAGESVTLTATVAESDGGTGVPTGAVDFSAGGSSLGSATLDGGVATLANVGGFLAGTQLITARYAGDSSNQGSTSSALSLTVNPAPTVHPTVTALAGSASSITAGDTVTFTATVTESDGGTGTPSGTVEFDGNGNRIGSASLNGSGVATLTTSGFVGGTYTITASYSGDASNAGSNGVVGLGVVAPPSITQTVITAGASPSPISTGSSVRLSAHVVQSGTQIPPPAGRDVIFSANGNRVGAAQLNGSGDASLDTSGWLTGHYTITASYVGDAFDAPAATSFGLDVLHGLSVIGPDVSMTYGGSVPALAPSYSGFENGDDVSDLTSQATCTAAVTSATPAGTYPVTCSGASSPSYVIAYSPGSITVKPATLTVTPSNALMAVGQPVPTLTATYTGFVNGETLATSGVTGSPLCTTTATSASPPGTYPITCAQGTLAASNYTFAFSGTGTLTVSATTKLTVTAPTLSVHQGDPIPALTPTYTGFVNGDTAASLDVQPTCTTTATSNSPAGSYPITCSGGVDADYTFVYVAGTLTITTGCFDVTVHPSCESLLASPVPMPGSDVDPGQTMLIFYVDDSDIGTGSNAPTAVLSTGQSLPVTVTPIFLAWPFWYVDDGRWGWAWHQYALTFQLPSHMTPGDYTVLVTAHDAQGDYDKFNWAVTVPGDDDDQDGHGHGDDGHGDGAGNGHGGGPNGHGHGHDHGPQSQDDDWD